jgi:t-SNARE complex subunit (syntaxin)
MQKNSELDDLLDSTNGGASQIRNRLKSMKQENDRLPGESAQKKIRTNMHSLLSKKFIALVQEYQTLQNSYKEKYRERVQRQAEIVKPGVSRDEVDEMIQSGGDMYSDKMMVENKHTEAKAALMQMQEQQKDIKHLERSIIELNQVFMDMSAIVESSSETVHRIEDSLTNTVTSTGVAITHLKAAEEYTMARRKRAAMLVTSVVVVILIIAGVFAALLATKVIAF